MPRKPKHYKASWGEQYGELQAMMQNGVSVASAANILGRTRHAIYTALYDHGDTLTELRGDTFAVRTVNQVAALFGVSHPTARDWVKLGWLTAAENGTRKQPGSQKPPHFLITDLALMDFIALRISWPAWEPARIADTYWRNAAHDERYAAGGQWVRAVELMRRQHYSEKYVYHLVRTGRLEATKIRNVWYVWEQL